jgi:LacI family transcriptional regulator
LKNIRGTAIDVIVPEIKHDYFSSAISGIEEVAYQSGCTVGLTKKGGIERRSKLSGSNFLLNVCRFVTKEQRRIPSVSKEKLFFNYLLSKEIPIMFGMGGIKTGAA